MARTASSFIGLVRESLALHCCTASNIVPTDANALAYSRSAGQVLNIVYLNRMAVDRGGFFPVGVNGNIKTSAAN